MPRLASLRRYAQAVFQIALERDSLDAWSEDLRVLAAVLENEAFVGLLDAPQVTAANKARAIREALDGSVDPLAVNLLSLLATRNLAYVVPGILDHYSRFLDKYRGIERAEVITAIPLDDLQRRKMTVLLSKMIGKQVRIIDRVDPQVLGGLIARVGDRLIDGSVRAKLEEMRREVVERVS